MGAKIRRYLLGGLMAVPLFFAPGTQSQATMVTVLTNGTGATGINNLSVDSVYYDIAFVAGEYADVFPGGELFSNAVSIVNAIDGALNTFSSPPPVIAPLSLSVSASTGFLIPIAFGDGGSALSTSRGLCPLAGPIFSCGGDYAQSAFIHTTAPFSATWAVPTLTPVPLPAALPLFGSALAMLGMVGWRRKRRAAA